MCVTDHWRYILRERGGGTQLFTSVLNFSVWTHSALHGEKVQLLTPRKWLILNVTMASGESKLKNNFFYFKHIFTYASWPENEVWMISTTFGPLVDHNSYLKQIFTWCRKFKMMCFLILKKIALIRYFQKTPFEGSFCQICWFFDGCWHFWISRKLAFDSPEAIVTWSINHFLGVKSWNFSTL